MNFVGNKKDLVNFLKQISVQASENLHTKLDKNTLTNRLMSISLKLETIAESIENGSIDLK